METIYSNWLLECSDSLIPFNTKFHITVSCFKSNAKNVYGIQYGFNDFE